jgi:type IV pilus assembly protein PilV
MSLSSSPQRGFTLIEVMVALIVLVLGVLGSAAMTLTALRDNKQSALRSQATAMAYELSDLMRANVVPTSSSSPLQTQESIFTGTQPTVSSITAACYVSGCTAAQMATSDYAQWLAKLTYSGANVAAGNAVSGLPNASAKVCRDSANLNSMTTCDNAATSPLVVKLQWDEKYNNGTYVAAQTGMSAVPNLVVVIQPY